MTYKNIIIAFIIILLKLCIFSETIDTSVGQILLHENGNIIKKRKAEYLTKIYNKDGVNFTDHIIKIISNESVTKNPTGMWLWDYMPNELIVRYNEDKNIENITFVYLDKMVLDAINYNKINISIKNNIIHGSILTLMGSYIFDNEFNRTKNIFENTNKVEKINTRFLYRKEEEDEEFIEEEKFFKRLDPTILEGYLDLYKQIEKMDDPNKYKYMDLISIPNKGGISGRRQRLWLLSEVKSQKAIAVMDLTQNKIRFGRELNPQTRKVVSFISEKESYEIAEKINDLSNLFPKNNRRRDFKLLENFGDKNVFFKKWKWNIVIETKNHKINGKIKDNFGNYAWYTSPKDMKIKRDISFIWNLDDDKLNGLDVYLPNRIRINRDNEMTLYEIYFMGDVEVQEGNRQIKKSVQFCLAILSSAGFFDHNARRILNRNDGSLSQNFNYSNQFVRATIPDNDDLLFDKTLISNLLPSNYIWSRKFIHDYKTVYVYQTKLSEMTTHDFQIQMFRAGNFGLLGPIGVYPKFGWAPISEVKLFTGNLVHDPIMAKLERKSPVADSLSFHIDYFDTGTHLLTKDIPSEKKPKANTENLIYKKIHEKLSPEDHRKVIFHIRYINIAKSLFVVNHKSSLNATFTPEWEDIQEYLEIPKDELFRPHKGLYQIRPLDSSATYGYPQE